MHERGKRLLISLELTEEHGFKYVQNINHNQSVG